MAQVALPQGIGARPLAVGLGFAPLSAGYQRAYALTFTGSVGHAGAEILDGLGIHGISRFSGEGLGTLLPSYDIGMT